MHDKANVALVLEQAYMGQLQALNRQLAEARDALTIERQRREEAEKALHEWEEWGDYPCRDPKDLDYNPSRAHFRKYDSPTDREEERAG